ncbi:hypothetical protein T02_657 [Trichinella nativa]|uniref:Uncharacterized protein n=1 Tax=Trichinella nativa TaxID=6335 RepID=A0A0V1L5I2_9BILA|nr:hypothetical protein T02_657 [Trichinella nativa]
MSEIKVSDLSFIEQNYGEVMNMNMYIFNVIKCRIKCKLFKNLHFIIYDKSIILSSPAGNRTRVARVTGGNTHHYTTEDDNYYNNILLKVFIFIEKNEMNHIALYLFNI